MSMKYEVVNMLSFLRYVIRKSARLKPAAAHRLGDRGLRGGREKFIGTRLL